MSYSSKNPKFSTTVLTDQGATVVSNPASGSHTLVDRNGSLWIRNSAGVEVPAGGAGSGEINAITDSNEAGNWAASAAGITVATSSTGSDLPLPGVIATAIKITPASGTPYVYYRFTMPSGIAAVKNKISWYQNPLAGYTSGDLTVQLYYNSASNYGGSYTQIPLSTDSAGVTAISSAVGHFQTTFDAPGSANIYYELRINRVSGTTACNIVDVIVGPGIQPQGAVVSAWNAFIPTGTWITNTTYTGVYRRIGDSLQIAVLVSLSGAPTSGGLSVNMPSGYTINTTAMLFSGATVANRVYGSKVTYRSGGIGYEGEIVYNTTSSVIPYALGSNTGVQPIDYYGQITSGSPNNFGGGDFVAIDFTVPVNELAGSGTVNVVQNDVEYASNSSTSTTATDTTSFAYGPGGAQIQSITAELERTVQFQTPLQATDSVILEIWDGVSGDGWMNVANGVSAAGGVLSFQTQGANTYGMGLLYATSTNNKVIVIFGQYATVGATYGATGTSWSGAGLNTYFWRVRKVKAGQAIGFGNATATSLGLVTASNGVVTAPTTGVFTNNTTTLSYQKTGKSVTLTYSGAVQAGDTTGPNAISISTVNLPANMLPPQTVYQSIYVNSAATPSYGTLAVQSSGALLAYMGTGTSFPSQSSTCGVYSFTISYVTAA